VKHAQTFARHNRAVPIEFSERIRRIASYPAAGGYADAGPDVRLASNESPYPPLPSVREAIARASSTLNRYPDPSNSLLRRRLSERYEVPISRIAIGNGSCDILLAAGEALLEPGAEIVHAWPSFSVYPHLSAASGARAVTVALDEEHLMNAARYVALNPVRARLVHRAEDWPHSSVRAHLAGRDDGLVRVRPLIDRAPRFADLLEVTAI